jgi:glycosyltransferase involved in cell wall biosynthesis
MATPAPVPARPEVSVIIPARNEEACLGTCLASLLVQEGISFEILVVDDHSTDRTREIAKSFPDVTVIQPGPLPPGWTGKNNAVTAGARVTRGLWLLFTDADTVHLPGSLARSLAEAKVHGAALLSYSPQQEVHGFWQNALMPVIFAELAATYRTAEVSDPSSHAAAANGQYLLVTRQAYDAVGGHAAIGNCLLEDVALARAVKQSGQRIFFRYGPDAVRTRMYRTFAQMCEGWTKNLALLFPAAQVLALRRLLEFELIAGCALASLIAWRAGNSRWGATLLLLAVITYVFHGARIARAHFSSRSNGLALFGLPLFSYLLVRSTMAHRDGKIRWKGRQYSGMAAGPAPE